MTGSSDLAAASAVQPDPVVADLLRRRFLFPYRLEPLAGDMGTRRYCRVVQAERDDGRPRFSAILMDSRAEPEPFSRTLAMLHAFARAGLRVPALLAVAPDAPVALLEDLGDDSLGDRLRRGEAAPAPALEDLFQRLDGMPEGLLPWSQPSWDAGHLVRQLGLADPGQAAAWVDALRSLRLRPQVIHRDLHADNILLTPLLQDLALIDVQDAGIGPAGYDRVSFWIDPRFDLDWEPRLAAIEGGFILGALRLSRIRTVLKTRIGRPGMAERVASRLARLRDLVPALPLDAG